MSDISIARAQAAMPADVELDVRALGTALWRGSLVVAAAIILALAATFMILSSMTPRYTAESRILIESGDNAFTRPLQTEAQGELSQDVVASQVQILMSRDLARNVIASLSLIDDPEFASEQPSILSRLLSRIGLSDVSRQSIEERVLDRFAEQLTIYQIGQTRIIAVAFTAADRALAAEVANAVAAAYIEMQQAARLDTTRLASTWLGSEIEALRGRVAEAESRVEAYRADSGLYAGADNTSLSTQQLTELNRQISEARAARLQAEARAGVIRDMLASGEPIDATTDVLASPLIQRLQETEVGLQARVAELSSTYLPQHPRMREIAAQLDDLQGQIREEAAKVARGLEGEAGLERAREASLMRQLDLSKTEAGRVNEQEVRLRALDREAAAERDLLESYLARYREASARESFAGLPADARIVSGAGVPNDPSSPKYAATLAAVGLAVLLLALGVLMTREFISGRAFVRHSAVSLPPLARAATVPLAPAEIVADEPVGRQAETIDALVHILRRRGLGVVAKRVVFATASDDVDATQSIVETARALSADAHRVVLVDANLERAQLGDLIEPRPAFGLSDLLAGGVSFSSVLFRDRYSRSHVIPAGVIDGTAVQLLASPRMEIVLDALAHTYDAVLIDSGSAAGQAAESLISRIDICVVVGSAKDAVDAACAALAPDAAQVVALMVPPVARTQEMPRRHFGFAAA